MATLFGARSMPETSESRAMKRKAGAEDPSPRTGRPTVRATPSAGGVAASPAASAAASAAAARRSRTKSPKSRAMTDRGSNSDADSVDEKKLRRMARNRLSAQLHRDRQKQLLTALQGQLQQATSELDLLRSQLAAVSKVATTCTCAAAPALRAACTDPHAAARFPVASAMHPEAMAFGGAKSGAAQAAPGAASPALDNALVSSHGSPVSTSESWSESDESSEFTPVDVGLEADALPFIPTVDDDPDLLFAPLPVTADDLMAEAVTLPPALVQPVTLPPPTPISALMAPGERPNKIARTTAMLFAFVLLFAFVGMPFASNLFSSFPSGPSVSLAYNPIGRGFAADGGYWVARDDVIHLPASVSVRSADSGLELVTTSTATTPAPVAQPTSRVLASADSGTSRKPLTLPSPAIPLAPGAEDATTANSRLRGKTESVLSLVSQAPPVVQAGRKPGYVDLTNPLQRLANQAFSSFVSSHPAPVVVNMTSAAGTNASMVMCPEALSSLTVLPRGASRKGFAGKASPGLELPSLEQSVEPRDTAADAAFLLLLVPSASVADADGTPLYADHGWLELDCQVLGVRHVPAIQLGPV